MGKASLSLRHDGETLEPMKNFEKRGATVTVIGSHIRKVTAHNSDVMVAIEKTIDELVVDDFQALIIPGGHSPGLLRQDEDVVTFVRDFVEAGKITAAICHGPQVLVSAEVLEGRKATCYSVMKHELIDAGAKYEDKQMIQDDNIITSRLPQDIPAFDQDIFDALYKGK